MIRSPERKIAISITLVILSIITIAIFSYLQTKKTKAVSSRIHYTQNILKQLGDIYTSVVDHASATRNYVLSGDQQIIIVMQSSAADAKLRLERLVTTVKDKPVLKIQSDSLEKYISKRINFSNQIINAGKEKGLSAATALYETGSGRDYTNMVLLFIQRMLNSELILLETDEQKNTAGIRQLGYSLLALLGFILALIIIIVQKIRFDNATQKKITEKLKQFNTSLEEQVKIKTADIQKSEKQLETSEKNLRQVLSSATENFYVIDKNYVVLIINEVAQKNLMKAWNYPIKKGTNIFEHLPDENKEPVRKSFDRAFAGENVEYELNLCIEGLPSWLIVNYIPVTDEHGTITGAGVYTRDISERRKAEEVMKASEERYRSLIEQASDSIIITDDTGNFYEANSAFCNRFGYTKEEAAQLHVSQVIDAEHLKKMPIRFDLLKQGHSVLRERKMVHKDGTIIDVEANVKMLPDGRMLVIARDIRERKKTEEEKEKIRYTLNERVKELTTLYRTGQLLQKADKPSAALMEEVISIIPGGWQYPEITAARIKLGERIFATKNFAEGFAKQSSSFQNLNGEKGTIEVVYLEEKPNEAEGPFLAEERNLLNMLAEMLQIYFDRKWADEKIKQSYEETRLLASHIENIREEEKIKIAREIHDELGQQITGLKMDVSWIAKKLNGENELLYQKTKDVLALLDETVRSVRRIASELRPGMLDDLGLIAAIDWQSKEFEKRSGIKIIFDHPVKEFLTPTNISTGLFRIFQESLTNVARHASATEILVSIDKTLSEIILKINDNGKGFDVAHLSSKRTLGLLGMKERTMMMGGRCDIFSEPGKGTSVSVYVPSIESNIRQLN